MILVETENARLKLALIIPTGSPITVANDAIERYQLLQTKQLMTCQNNKKSNIFIKSFTH